LDSRQELPSPSVPGVDFTNSLETFYRNFMAPIIQLSGDRKGHPLTAPQEYKVSIDQVSVEEFAQLFHHYHDALAPDFHCRPEPHGESWQELPANERSRFIAAARLALMEVASTAGELANDRERYFAKPGEAEWGC
jgi:hypothetical protein